MQHSWADVVRPLLEASAPRTMLEIGVGDGGNTRQLAEFARNSGCRMHSVDPYPQVDVDTIVREFHPHLAFHVARSLAAINLIGPVDVALVDGDHNWHTVFHELVTLYRVSHQRARAAPIVLLHDVGWPYGRRDAYLDHELPSGSRHPWSVGGVFPGRGLPIHERGLNWTTAHANHEGGPHNGIRTAVEDYVTVAEEPLRFVVDPCNWGVGVLVAESRLEADPVVSRVIDAIAEPDRLARRAEIERQRVSTLMASYSPT